MSSRLLARVALAALLLGGLCACGDEDLGPGALGRFRLDRPAMERMFVEDLGHAPDHARTEARAVRMAIDFRGDNTFLMQTQSAGRKVLEAKGTWALNGTALTITTTHQDGRKVEPPRVEHGQLEDPELTITPTGSMAYRLILRRVP